MTELLTATPGGISRAAELLRAGLVVAFPTDTVYGVAVLRDENVGRLFALKQRPLDRRIPLLVAGIDAPLDRGWFVDERARALAAAFWPGPLTLVLRRGDGQGNGRGDETQAFRAPDHPVALALIAAAGPLLATSANVSDQPDTLAADEVLVAFATQQDELAAVLDGGSVPGGVASTVLDLTCDPARILRPGPVSTDALRALVEVTDAGLADAGPAD